MGLYRVKFDGIPLKIHYLQTTFNSLHRGGMLKRKNDVKAWKTGQLFHLTPGSQNTNQRTYATSPSSTSSPPLLLSPNPSFPPLSSLETPVSLIVPFLGENRITIRFLGSFGALFFYSKTP